ncbi:GNAT family N-acetyltransferase [Tenacibaculum geojense]|uniref:GNAT family N-acetyltransferase n=1 Tax=Tenacibaculum geojense TaxID=915352 RepID=A0ABW3JPB5_9FLAO
MVKKITPEETYFLRKNVLRKNIDLPYKFQGDLNKETFHLGVFNNSEIVCIGTFMSSNLNQLQGNKHYQLRGMATAENSRGNGFGLALIKESVTILKSKNVDYLWCNARVEAVGFYQKLGFKVIGKSFNVEKVGEHYKMYKKV